MIGERLADQANRARIEVRQRAPELLPHAIAASSPAPPRRVDEFPASGIDGSRRIRRDAVESSAAAPSASPRSANRRCARLEERQRQQLAMIAGNGHHRPTNSGLPRAAKAVEGAFEILRLHADRLGLRLRLDAPDRGSCSTPGSAWSSSWRAQTSGRPRTASPVVSRRGEQLIGFEQSAVEAPRQTLLGRHRPSREQQFGGPSLTDEPRQDGACAHVAAGEPDAREEKRGARGRWLPGAYRRPWR